ncbi:MAG: helix-turn-helix domain-containing protein [Alistipes sp.]|nr:helix-turn-helix domain-containing protein [Alistipes sp.]
MKRDRYFEYAGVPIRNDVTTAIFIRRGRSRVRIDMREYAVNAPCMMVILAEQVYQLLDCSDDIEVTAMVMSQNFSQELFYEQGVVSNLYKQVVGNPIMDLSGDLAIYDAYFALLANLMRSPHRQFKLEAAKHLTLSMFYGYTHMRHSLTQVRPRSGSELLAERFEELLRSHYARERGVEFYARQLCVTPKYLSQVLKRTSGQSALKRIEEYVVTEAKLLLSTTDMTIQQISYALNFPSQSVFGKYFKRITGLSPMDYRRRLCR